MILMRICLVSDSKVTVYTQTHTLTITITCVMMWSTEFKTSRSILTLILWFSLYVSELKLQALSHSSFLLLQFSGFIFPLDSQPLCVLLPSDSLSRSVLSHSHWARPYWDYPSLTNLRQQNVIRRFLFGPPLLAVTQFPSSYQTHWTLTIDSLDYCLFQG